MIVRCQQEDTGLNLDPKPGLVKDIMWRVNVFYEKGRDFGEPHVGVQWSDQLPGLAEQFCSCMASGKVMSPVSSSSLLQCVVMKIELDDPCKVLSNAQITVNTLV